MSMSEFETLRADLLAMRRDMDQRFDQQDKRFDLIEERFKKTDTKIDERFNESDKRFNRLEAKLDEKPGMGALYQITFGGIIGLALFAFAVTGLLRNVGVIP